MLRIRPASAALVVLVTVLSFSFSSRAQVATTPKDDLTTLERNLAEQSAALSTSDCATACRALASILRAADRICALEPGERCAAGRAKADDATRRVREACPECAIATAPKAPTPKPAPAPSPEREERAMTKAGTSADSVQTAAAPPPESKRGGCAGCTTSPTSPGDLTTAALAVSALAFVLRRRRKRAA